MTRFAARWIVDDDKAAFDFDSVDGNYLGLTGFKVNLGKKLDGWIDPSKAAGHIYDWFGSETHLVQLDENYFAFQYFVAQDSHL